METSKGYRIETYEGRVIETGYPTLAEAKLSAWKLRLCFKERLLIFDENDDLQT